MKNEKYHKLLLGIFSLISAYLTCFSIFYIRKDGLYDDLSVFMNTDGMRIETFCCILAGAFLYHRVYQLHDRRVTILSAAGALFFTVCHILGYNTYEYDTLWLPQYCREGQIAELACILGTFLMFNGLLRVCLFYFKNHPVPLQTRVPQWFSTGWRSFLVYFSVVFAAHLLFLSVFYSGVVSRDTQRQIAEGLGVIPLSDFNPYFHTLVLGSIIRLGRALFGTILDGVVLCTLVQAALISLAVSYILLYMAGRKVHIGFRIAVLAYFTLHPVILCNDATLWKDIWQGYFMLIYVVLMVELGLSSADFFRKKGNLILLLLALLGTLFFKNTGIFVVLVSLPFFLVSAAGHRKTAAAIFTASLCLFFFSRYVIIPSLGIEDNPAVEPLSLPVQQVARTLSKDWDSVSQEHKDILEEVVSCEQVKQAYKPDICDPVKNLMNRQAFESNLGRYGTVWLKMGLEHPKTYLESFLAGSAGYWYTGIDFWKVATLSYLDGQLVDGSGAYGGFTDPDAKSYDYEIINPEKRQAFKEGYEKFRGLPGIGTLSSIAGYFWSCVLMAMVCILKKRYRMLLPLSAVLGVFFVCILSPVFAECRYAYLALLVQPVLWPFVLQDSFAGADSASVSKA